jgi:tetratricopeptide (TPR) repeat protein
MFRTKAAVEFVLRPDRACLEVRVRLVNRTSEPQTFLWWANPAVHVNENTQSLFPKDVRAVMDHGKRAASDFPIATGTYYKVNYAPGTDISWYKNIPVPTSFMAAHSDFDFIGCYDHEKEAGMMHVADHHTVPGKKQWTWGNGEFGRAWDRHLTDEDGPYVELMCGAYTDNQPDFSWLMPGEEKAFTQLFMPFKRIGGAVNAGKHGTLNLRTYGNYAVVGVYLNSPQTARVELLHRGQIVFDAEQVLGPETAFVRVVDLPHDTDRTHLLLRVLREGRVLLQFSPPSEGVSPVPPAAVATRQPKDIVSNEELFLNGLHLEQYRHATTKPEPYYEEALRRDPFDSRCNNALGLLLYRRGRFAEAEPFFRKAIQSLTRRNPNPYDGEPYYNLGLCLKMQGRHDEAFDAIYKSVWNEAWQSAGYFELARLACRQGRLDEALELIERSLAKNARSQRAGHLKTALLRLLGRTQEALSLSAEILKADPLEFGALNEQRLLGMVDAFNPLLRDNIHARIEIALDYTHAGLLAEAAQILEEAASQPRAKDIRSSEREAASGRPMAYYYLGWVRMQTGDEGAARRAFSHASRLPADFIFPNEIECIPALLCALQTDRSDARAYYALGNFWYAHARPVEAEGAWEKAARLEPSFPTVHRNLALLYYNKQDSPVKAVRMLEKAFRLDPSDARVFYELDQLNKKRNVSAAVRLKRMEKHFSLVAQRDDLYLEYVTLLNLKGRRDEALDRLLKRRFHPWEGGEGKAAGQYVRSLIETACIHLAGARFREAVETLDRSRVYPESLGEGKLAGDRENPIFYFLGLAHEGLGNEGKARECYRRASAGDIEPSSAVYYNDQPPDRIFFQGLAWRKMGQERKAESVFHELAEYGRAHMRDDVRIDYFAVSLPDFLVFEDDLNLRNRVHCHYMKALGLLGLGRRAQAKKELERVLESDAAHGGAVLHKRLIEWRIV